MTNISKAQIKQQEIDKICANTLESISEIISTEDVRGGLKIELIRQKCDNAASLINAVVAPPPTPVRRFVYIKKDEEE